jgi:cysteine-rich repeat protein
LASGFAVTLVASGCLYEWPTSGIDGDAGIDGDGGPVCGNGRIEGDESCDGSQLGGESCASLGFGGGTLACDSDCEHDTTDCREEQVCGDGYVGSEEQCDDGNDAGGDGCDANCLVEQGWACEGEPSVCIDGCGNGVCHLGGGEDGQSCAEDCGWVDVAAGEAHTCAVKADGTAWCWGDNSAGQLGDGTTEDRATPVPVVGLTDVRQVAVGGSHGCAVSDTGAVWCWGRNGDGQLGDGTIIDAAEPQPVKNLFDAVRLAAGSAHTCAITTGAGVWCWGRNDDGQLGDGTPVSRQEPTAVAVGAGLTAAREVAAGGRHSCAIHEDGTVWCWGDNAFGQLGTGDFQPSLLPLAVGSGAGFGGQAERITAGQAHTCALHGDGNPWCWGEGDQRRLGDGGSQDQSAPVSVLDVGAALDVTAGAAHTCAVAQDGTPWCWGNGGEGRLGIGSTPPQQNPTALGAPVDGLRVVAGARHGCALTVARALLCWGDNAAGQLGDGSGSTQTTAAPVVDPY